MSQAEKTYTISEFQIIQIKKELVDIGCGVSPDGSLSTQISNLEDYVIKSQQSVVEIDRWLNDIRQEQEIDSF